MKNTNRGKLSFCEMLVFESEVLAYISLKEDE